MNKKKQKLSKVDIYNIALKTRNMEIDLFWRRSNYFLVLNTAVATAFISQKVSEADGNINTDLQLLFSIFGLLISILWFRVNLGGKYWQSRWEQRLHLAEEKLSPSIKLFSSDWKEINNDVEEQLGTTMEDCCLVQFLNKQILKKPSVSKAMITLSILFIFFWIYLLYKSSGISIIELLTSLMASV